MVLKPSLYSVLPLPPSNALKMWKPTYDALKGKPCWDVDVQLNGPALLENNLAERNLWLKSFLLGFAHARGNKSLPRPARRLDSSVYMGIRIPISCLP